MIIDLNPMHWLGRKAVSSPAKREAPKPVFVAKHPELQPTQVTAMAEAAETSLQVSSAAKAVETNMGFIKDVESEAGKIEAEITKLWDKAPSFDTVALTTLKTAAPVLEFALSVEDPAALLIVQPIISAAETDLISAQSLISQIGATPSVKNIIAGVASNLTTLLGAAKIKNPVSVQKVTGVVSILQTLVAAFPVAATTAAGVSIG